MMYAGGTSFRGIKVSKYIFIVMTKYQSLNKIAMLHLMIITHH